MQPEQGIETSASPFIPSTALSKCWTMTQGLVAVGFKKRSQPTSPNAEVLLGHSHLHCQRPSTAGSPASHAALQHPLSFTSYRCYCSLFTFPFIHFLIYSTPLFHLLCGSLFSSTLIPIQRAPLNVDSFTRSLIPFLFSHKPFFRKLFFSTIRFTLSQAKS
jgi:hypothetical protein